MRVSPLSVKSVAILSGVALGVFLAQQAISQPAGQPPQPAGRGQQPAGRGQQPVGRGQPAQAPGAGPGAAQPLPGIPLAPALDDVTYKQQISYRLGQNFGEGLRESEVDLDMQMLLAGLNAALKNEKPRWTDDELMPAMTRFSQEMERKASARMDRVTVKNKQQEEAFLAENKKRQGVQVTASGLQYKVIQQGNGPSPTPQDVVRCNYRGQLLDGTEFDSSQRHGGPQQFPVGRVIAGWTEALQKMKVGDKWQLFVPARLAYDMQPPGPPIEPGSMLIFEIELLGIVK